MPIAPADYSYLGLSGPALQLAMLLTACAALAWILGQRLRLLRRAAPDRRTDRLGARLSALVVVGFGQSRQLRYAAAGVLHILIFAGFLILSVRSLTLIGEGFHAGSSDIGPLYASVKDWTALVVLLCCAIAAGRRFWGRPARYRDRLRRVPHGLDPYVILGWIAFLMLADALFDGSALAASGAHHGGGSMPLASAAAALLGGASADALETVGLSAFWLHDAALLGFLCYLPLSKHFHVLTALPNVFFRKLGPSGRLAPAPVRDAGARDAGVRGTGVRGAEVDGAGSSGIARIEDFTWKHVLDFYSCTDCGRCSDQCPAYRTGAPLSPRMISIESRELCYAAYPVLGRPVPPERQAPLCGGAIRDEALWACTTCGACEETCPLLIEYVDKIVGMRRHLVDEGRIPKGLRRPLAELQKRGNPYGKPPRARGDWADAAGVRVLGQGEAADALLFTDSAAAYDPRLQKTVRAFAAVLAAAGVDCGTLGRDEVDSGHEARRLGEEGLFELLRDQNQQALEEREFARVLTTDPHAFNALRHDYGLAAPVLHHTEVLAELVANGRIELAPAADGRVHTFHDPCYLGRHNGVYDAPRSVLDAISGLRTVEMDRARNRSFCCGGGSLYLFSEGECERRMGEVRVEMALDAGAQVVVTACPFCLTNLEDAVKTTGVEDRIEVIDLAELVDRHRVATQQPAVEEPAAWT